MRIPVGGRELVVPGVTRELDRKEYRHLGPGYYKMNLHSDFSKAVEIRDCGVMNLTTPRFGWAVGNTQSELARPEYANMGPGYYDISTREKKDPQRVKRANSPPPSPHSDEDGDGGAHESPVVDERPEPSYHFGGKQKRFGTC